MENFLIFNITCLREIFLYRVRPHKSKRSNARLSTEQIIPPAGLRGLPHVLPQGVPLPAEGHNVNEPRFQEFF